MFTTSRGPVTNGKYFYVTRGKGPSLVFPVHKYVSTHDPATFTHNRVIYTALRLPETKGNDFPVFIHINNFRLYGGGPHCVLTAKYFIP